ncbi:MAG TPA: hypothetical protein VFQ61_12855 [Polyangiaceae bacterium]|nr:hypothetical protein [Polyangiaceae bacterium]
MPLITLLGAGLLASAAQTAPAAVLGPAPTMQSDRVSTLASTDSKNSCTPAPDRRAYFSARLALGLSSLKIYSVPISSREISLGLGARSGAQAAFFSFTWNQGETQFGLDTKSWHLALGGETSYSRLRGGAELRFGRMIIQSLTRDENLSSLSIGPALYAQLDVIRLRHTDALYLEAAGRADYYSPWVFEGSVKLGYRFSND